MSKTLVLISSLVLFLGCAFPKSEATDVDIDRILADFQQMRYSYNLAGGNDKQVFFSAAKKFNLTSEAARLGLKQYKPKVYKKIFKD